MKRSLTNILEREEATVMYMYYECWEGRGDGLIFYIPGVAGEGSRGMKLFSGWANATVLPLNEAMRVYYVLNHHK